MTDDRPLTAKEAAVFLRCSVSKVRRRAASFGGKKLPGCRDWLFPREELQKLLR